MKKAVAFLLAAAIIASAGGGYYHLIYKRNQSSTQGRVSSTADNAVYVTKVSTAIGLGSGTGVLQRYGGMVVPQETWEAKLESDRSVKETHVEVGDIVKAGDKLFTYDTSEDEDKIAQAEIDIERSQNEIKNSEATLVNLEKQLASAKAADKPSYENLILSEQNSIKQAEYDIKSKELEIESLKNGMENADVVSKIDGVIKSISNPDSTTSSYGDSSDAYITVMATGDLRVEGKVNEQNIRSIYEGAEVICFSRVDSSQYWLGSIAEIKRESGSQSSGSDSDYYDSSDSSGSTSYPFYVKLESSDDLILGQHLYIELNEGQLNQKEGMWIPEYYLNSEEDGSFWVWAASEKDTLEKRTLTLGEYNEAEMTYEVLEGLAEDDYIAAPDDRYAEGDPLIFNDDVNASDDEDVYGMDDIYGGSYDEFNIDDGSFDDYYFDEGSLDWWDDEDEWGSVYIFDEDEDWDDEDEEWDDEDPDDEGWVDLDFDDEE